MRQGILLLGLAAMIILAGCTGANTGTGKGVNKPVSTVGVDDSSKGKVIGSIMNDENLPIEGAGVALLGTSGLSLAAVTDTAGGFAFLGVEPGAYVVTAQKIGFEDFTRKDVQVSAGESTALDIILIPLPSNEPYYDVTHFVSIVSGYCYRLPAGGRQCLPLALGNDFNKAALTWATSTRAAALQGVVGELKWTNGQALAGDLIFTVFAQGDGIGEHEIPERQFVRVEGPSPLRGYSDAAHTRAVVAQGGAECNPEFKWCLIGLLVEPSDGNTNGEVDFGVVLQQKFEAAVGTFYNMDAPLDFTSFA